MNALMLNGSIRDPEERTKVIEEAKLDKQLNITELRIIRGKPVQDQFGPGLPHGKFVLSAKSKQTSAS